MIEAALAIEALLAIEATEATFGAAFAFAMTYKRVSRADRNRRDRALEVSRRLQNL